mgnify:CR=1 FL=1
MGNDSVLAMKPSQTLEKHRAEIRDLVASHHAENVRVFGSVARQRDMESSDLDLLVDPTPETSLFDIGAIRHELRALLGCPVDVYTPESLPAKNRDVILAQARPL